MRVVGGPHHAALHEEHGPPSTMRCAAQVARRMATHPGPRGVPECAWSPCPPPRASASRVCRRSCAQPRARNAPPTNPLPQCANDHDTIKGIYKRYRAPGTCAQERQALIADLVRGGSWYT